MSSPVCTRTRSSCTLSQINTPLVYPASMRAVGLQNEAGALQRSGNREAALVKFREALQLKLTASGEHSIAVGITLDSMGVCLIELNRLEEAEAVLRRAQVIRDDLDRGLDAAVTRDNLGRALEMQGPSSPLDPLD